MTIKIKTKDIDIEYTDEYSGLETDTVKKIKEIIESLKVTTNPKCKYCGGEDKGQ